MINVLLIGLGPHARRIQLPILLKDGPKYVAAVKAIIDLASQKDVIENYLHVKTETFTPELLFLTKEQARLEKGELSPGFVRTLDSLVKKWNINAVFICTEPACHTPYAKWALRKALHVFMDKPISAPLHLATSVSAIDRITGDYLELADLYKKQKTKHPGLIFELMTQRRYHPAFHELDRLIREVKERTGVPITSFQSTHNDGQWRMPDEIVDQDYHPYNQGYGKCLHSGYHSIDITSWLVRRSYASTHKLKDVELFANLVYPNDFLAQLPLDRYLDLFSGFEQYRKYSPEVLAEKYETYGEIDIQISAAFKDEEGRTLTAGQLSLLHNSVAQRNWPTAEGRDLYKGNGRVRHEAHYLVQGPFQTIYFQSLQSEEILNEKVNHSDIGGEYHLDIHVFRNNKMLPQWKAYEKISLNDLAINILEGYSRGHQEDARRAAILTFLRSVNDTNTLRYSDLLDQDYSIGMIGATYRSALYRKLGLNPLVKVSDELSRPTKPDRYIREV
jgi:predicted dehydrogenase